ncbi:kinase-like domain-containing protein [Obelidium mucronatum]|nr:kinase-like domain-containing protein [Obelidium mucronatum]
MRNRSNALSLLNQQINNVGKRHWGVHQSVDAWISRLAENKNSAKLRELFAEATSTISQDKFKADKRVLDIWLEHLRLESLANENYDEIRDKYKYLKSRAGSSSASLFIHWARFEQSCGFTDRAYSIIQSGIDSLAQPLCDLENELENLKNTPPRSTVESKPPCTPLHQQNHQNHLVHQPITTPIIPASGNKSSKEKMQRLLAGVRRNLSNLESAQKDSANNSAAALNTNQRVSASLPPPNPTKLTAKSPTITQEATPPQAASSQPQTATNSLADTAVSIAPPSTSKSKIQSMLNEFKMAGAASNNNGNNPSQEEETKTMVANIGNNHPPIPSTPVIQTTAVPATKPNQSNEYFMPLKEDNEDAAQSRQRERDQQQQQHNHQKDKGLYITVNRVPYKRIELIGRGASSKVYKVISESGRIFALKKVKLDRQDPSAIEGYLNEIQLLKKLAKSECIISLIDSEICHVKKHLLLLLEYGEIDLAHLLAKDKSLIGNLNFIRMHWTQMLQAVQQIHNEKIVHSDLKPANFLIVEGKLKLIDFGIAKAIPSDTTNIQRDYQTGTLNYMAPEAILFTESNSSSSKSGQHLKLGRASDIWSLGCILYQLVYGQPPFAALPIVQKLNAIVDPNYKITFQKTATDKQSTSGSDTSQEPSLLQVLKSCLNRDPKARMTIPELLEHPFLHPNSMPAKSAVAAAAVEGRVFMSKSDIQKVLEMGIQLGVRSGKGVTSNDVERLVGDIYSQFGGL